MELGILRSTRSERCEHESSGNQYVYVYGRHALLFKMGSIHQGLLFDDSCRGGRLLKVSSYPFVLYLCPARRGMCVQHEWAISVTGNSKWLCKHCDGA